MTHLDDGADLRAVMDRSLRDVDVPVHCGPTALVTGRRIRRRRRAAAALTGVATVAALATALAVPALGGSDDVAPDAPIATDPAPTPAPTESATAAPAPPAGWWDVPSTQMVVTLESLLPAGVAVTRADTTADGPDGDVAAVGSLSGTLESSAGPGAFQILLYPPEPTDVPEPVTTTDAAGNEHTTAYAEAPAHRSRIKCRRIHQTCAPINDASGEQVGRVSTDTYGGTSFYEVALLGPGEGALYFYVADSTGEKPGYEAPSAEAPPLTVDQLRALAGDPKWTGWTP